MRIQEDQENLEHLRLLGLSEVEAMFFTAVGSGQLSGDIIETPTIPYEAELAKWIMDARHLALNEKKVETERTYQVRQFELDKTNLERQFELDKTNRERQFELDKRNDRNSSWWRSALYATLICVVSLGSIQIINNQKTIEMQQKNNDAALILQAIKTPGSNEEASRNIHILQDAGLLHLSTEELDQLDRDLISTPKKTPH